MFKCSQKHDLKPAQKLCDLLGINQDTVGRLLHVGSGTGTLVYETWKLGLDSYGCETDPPIQGYAKERIYELQLEDIHFPTDRFQWVVMAIPEDHSRMVSMLGEAFRVTDQQGRCFIGLPLVFYQEGVSQACKAGFVDVVEVSKNEDGAMFSARKPEQRRVSLLLPPGVGDVYWPLVKTQALLCREGIEPPVDVYAAAPRAKKYNSEARSFPFLEMFPFLHSTGEVRFGRGPIWREAYLQPGRTVFRDVQGCDYFITWNGHLRAGRTLEEIDPDLDCNWDLPRFISLKEEAYRNASLEGYGDYLVLYWSFLGTNRQILRHFTLEQIASMVGRIVELTGLRPILIGAAWDLDCPELERLYGMLPDNTVDLRGKTDLEEVFGLMRGARAVLGMNSGITVMSAAFGVKTVMLVHDYLFSNGVHRDFAWNTVPPSVRRRTYFAEYADETTPDGLVDRVLSLVNGTPFVGGKAHTTKDRAVGPIGRPCPSGGREAISSIRGLECMGHGSFNGSIAIACVLRSGGDFDERYVKNLRNMLQRNLTRPFRFVCLTDLPSINGVEMIRLSNGHPGWWSKIELFRPGWVDVERILYFDLDTIILRNIDDMLALNDDFYGLRPWNRRNRMMGNCASGIMSWKNGAYDFLYDEFNADRINQMGDQAYISAALREHGGKFTALQDAVPGIYSYKRECRSNPPDNARVVCFHGRPRIHECRDHWAREAWK